MTMQQTGNNIIAGRKPRTTIRVGNRSLAFAIADDNLESLVAFEPYIVKSGVSKAANLRQAFKSSNILLAPNHRALVSVDAKMLLVPTDEYVADNKDELYHHCFSAVEGVTVMDRMLPTLNAVALFGVNSDLKLVVDDHYEDVRFQPLMLPILEYLHKKSLGSVKKRLYCYFHDGKLEVVSFDKTRIRFYNQFEAPYSRDAAYYMLYVWKQLGFEALDDELFLCGDMPDKTWLVEAMKNYLKKVFVINITADFNRSPITKIQGMPIDMMMLYL